MNFGRHLPSALTAAVLTVCATACSVAASSDAASTSDALTAPRALRVTAGVIADLRPSLAAGSGGSGPDIDIAGTFHVTDEDGDGLESITIPFEPSLVFAPIAGPGEDDLTSPAFVRIGSAEGSGAQAQALFNAMTRAIETTSDGGPERTSAGGNLSCSHLAFRTECQIGRVRGVAPPGGSDTSTLVSTEYSVIQDIASALDPSMSPNGVNVPNVLTATVGKGIFRLKIEGKVGVTAPVEDAQAPRFRLAAEFGGLAMAGQPMSAEMTAAKALYDAMTEAVVQFDPSTQTTSRMSRGARVLCSTHPLEFTGAFYSCHINGVRFIDP